jgi:hypothetical protein
MKYTVENGIPMPPINTNGDSLAQFLKKLEVGQSVFIENKKPTQLGSFINRAKRGTEKAFACRSIEGGARIWRIE